MSRRPYVEPRVGDLYMIGTAFAVVLVRHLGTGRWLASALYPVAELRTPITVDLDEDSLEPLPRSAALGLCWRGTFGGVIGSDSYYMTMQDGQRSSDDGT